MTDHKIAARTSIAKKSIGPHNHKKAASTSTTKPEPCYLTPGKYSTGRMSSYEDFKEAEWHGEEELDGDQVRR